jgi:hypothetical protein
MLALDLSGAEIAAFSSDLTTGCASGLVSLDTMGVPVTAYPSILHRLESANSGCKKCNSLFTSL